MPPNPLTQGAIEAMARAAAKCALWVAFALLPKGQWQLAPIRATAENGMKAALIGEFSVPVETVDEDGDPITMTILVPWTTIKEIYSAALAAAPKFGDAS